MERGTIRRIATKWGARLAILAAIPAIIAATDAMVRPLPDGLFEEEKEERRIHAKDAGEGTEAWAQEVAWLVEAFDQGAFFIDARTRAAFTSGHVAGAVHLPFEAFHASAPPAVLDFLPRDQSLVIYCDGGDCDASHNVRRMLRTHGYTDLRVFEPGWPGIEDAGLPIVEGEGDW